MAECFDDILKMLPKIKETCDKLQEIVLANLVMIGEIPAPTFGEKARVEFLRQRLSENGLQNCSIDEVDNAAGILPGKDPDAGTVMAVPHTDPVSSAKADHTYEVRNNVISGAGVSDNSLGLAVMASLPRVFEELGIELRSDLLILGASRSLGRGNLEGLRFFLNHTDRRPRAGVCIEGVQLGRLSMNSIGMLRGEITCSVGEKYDWTRFGTTNAILTLNEVITKILEVPTPRRPRTSIVLGSIEGGTSFNTIATNAVLRFEIRSESKQMVEDIATRMEDIIAAVESQTESDVRLDIFARREPGGISQQHPMARCVKAIMRELEINPRFAPSTSELSAFIDQGIPAVTVGITTAEHLNEPHETVNIERIFDGMAQLVAILLAIDGGYCDED